MTGTTDGAVRARAAGTGGRAHAPGLPEATE